MSDTQPEISATGPATHRRWYRLALAVTILLVVFVLVMLPLAIGSMQEVLGRGPDPLYDLVTGAPLTSAAAVAAEAEATYFNLGVIDLDVGTGLATLAVSGNRICAAACPALTLTLVSLDDDADQRRGLPPLATLTLKPDDRVFSQSVQLPVRGQPSLYPFDTYQLWLGVVGVATLADGTTVELHPDTLGGRVLTLQNREGTFIMRPPDPIDPQRVHAETDPFAFLAVQNLTFARPAYLQILTVVLVLLIAVSAVMALLTRAVNDLALGIGGLILGIWGVRSVLAPQPLPGVSALDLALSWLILILLLGLALRAAHHFHRHSELPLPKPTLPRARPHVPHRPPANPDSP